MTQQELDKLMPRPKQGESLYIMDSNIYPTSYKRYVYLGYRWHDLRWVLKDVEASEKEGKRVTKGFSQAELLSRLVFRTKNEAKMLLWGQIEEAYQNKRMNLLIELRKPEPEIEKVDSVEGGWYDPTVGPKPVNKPKRKTKGSPTTLDDALFEVNRFYELGCNIFTYGEEFNRGYAPALRQLKASLNIILKQLGEPPVKEKQVLKMIVRRIRPGMNKLIASQVKNLAPHEPD